MPPEGTAWIEVVERVIDGDAAAFARLARLVSGALRRCRAYDFEAEWDDVIQEVVLQTVRIRQDGRLSHHGAVVSFIRTATRNKVVDRIRRFQRRESREVAEDSTPLVAEPEPETSRLDAMDLRAALEQLPEGHRRAVIAVYVEGRTYEEASENTGIPLGTLKRYLRKGLAELEEALSAQREKPDDG